MPAYAEVNWLVQAIEGICQDPDLLDDANIGQGLATWVRLMKELVRSPVLRDATDWNLTKVGSHVNASAELDADGGVVYGVFGWTIDTTEPNLIILRDTTTAVTFASGAMNAAEDAAGEFATVNIPAATAATEPGYGTIIVPEGIAFTVGITIGADGIAGTAPGANETKAYYIWRATVEARAD